MRGVLLAVICVSLTAPVWAQRGGGRGYSGGGGRSFGGGSRGGFGGGVRAYSGGGGGRGFGGSGGGFTGGFRGGYGGGGFNGFRGGFRGNGFFRNRGGFFFRPNRSFFFGGFGLGFYDPWFWDYPGYYGYPGYGYPAYAGPAYGGGYGGAAYGGGYGGGYGSPGVTVVSSNYYGPSGAQEPARGTGNDSYRDEYAAPAPREYRSDGPREYRSQAGSAAAPRQDEDTLYLIAFKDGVIRPALAYWVEKGELHFITMDHESRRVPLSTIDRQLSERLNGERRVPFRIPAA